MVKVGKILKPHGVKGALKVMPLTDDMHRFDLLDEISIFGAHGVETYSISQVRYQDKFVLLELVGIETMNEAEKYSGRFLAIKDEERMPLEEGRYYIDDLVGCDVFEDERHLGQIKEVLQPGSNDVYVVARPEGGELLLPALFSVVKKVDIAHKRMEVIVPKGLMED